MKGIKTNMKENKFQIALNRVKTLMSNKDSDYKQYSDSYLVFAEDINMLQELVDKETPKEVIKRTEFESYGCDDQCCSWENRIVECPTCESRLFDDGTEEYEGVEYCPYCGQHLYWSEE